MKFKIPVNSRKVQFNIDNYIEDNLKNIKLINEEYFNDIQGYTEKDPLTDKFIYFSLFQNYFQGLEIIFSLIASIIQAPYYYYGWILSYRNSDLFDLVGEITNSNYIENAHKLEKVSWIEISKIIHSGFLEEKDQSVEMYAKLWEKLAKEYLSSDYQETYNAIKHGLRLQTNAITELKIQDMIFTGSDYGFQFGRKIKNDDGSFSVKYKIVNFDKDLFEYYFEFFRMTIHNVKAFLKTVNIKGKVEVTQYSIFNDFYEKLMSKSIKIHSLTFNELL